jgi:hypothetical protein
MNIFSKALAEASSGEQAKFFNDFSRYLKVLCGDRVQSQFCWIADELDSNSRELITDLAEFIKLNDESRPKHERSLSDIRNEHRMLEKQVAELKEKLEEEES